MNRNIQNSDDGREHADGLFAVLREWGDALIIAFVLAMFVRVFVVELFKIPSGSMSPTLLGDDIAEVDMDGDGLEDLVVAGPNKTLVFINKGNRYLVDESIRVSRGQLAQWQGEGVLKREEDRILVNKFAYWWRNPKRGDVIVFKVPEQIWQAARAIYIKRVAAGPGDTITFDGRLVANGERVETPEFYRTQEYLNEVSRVGSIQVPWITYRKAGASRLKIDRVDVPPGMLFVMGDNTRGSLDSRSWGGVPVDNVKGKAFLRYWPLRKIKFIR